MSDGTRFDPEEFERTMKALKDGTSCADVPARPLFDPAQYRNVVEDAVHGRRVEDFKVALERGGFVFFPKGSIPPGCESTNPLEPPRPLVEGQWRRAADRKLPMRLAFTDNQVVAWFSTPEEFWRWLMDLSTKEQLQAKRQASKPLRLAMSR
jgi:hypothetical protein